MGGELAEGHPLDPVTERTQAMAKERAKEVERETRKWLADVLDVVSPDILEAIVDKKRQLAVEAVQAARKAGKMNDEISLTPGITLFLRLDKYPKELRHPLDPISFEELKEQADRGDMAFDLYKLEKYSTEENFEWYRWTLPDAAYQADKDLNRILISDAAEFDQQGELGAGGSWLVLLPECVGRIEGASGELWQNPRLFLPDVESPEAPPPQES